MLPKEEFDQVMYGNLDAIYDNMICSSCKKGGHRRKYCRLLTKFRRDMVKLLEQRYNQSNSNYNNNNYNNTMVTQLTPITQPSPSFTPFNNVSNNNSKHFYTPTYNNNQNTQQQHQNMQANSIYSTPNPTSHPSGSSYGNSSTPGTNTGNSSYSNGRMTHTQRNLARSRSSSLSNSGRA